MTQETQDIAVSEVARRILHYWWIPVLLALLGTVVGVSTARMVSPVHRAQATVLVGPTQGSVTHSSTIRASEDLATFYADMARREVVLRPVVERLRLPLRWDELRNEVSATVPPQNLRLVQVAVVGSTQHASSTVANAIARQLVTLSPPLAGGNEQAFVNEQVTHLKSTIADGEGEVKRLKGEMPGTTDPIAQDDLRRQIRQQQRLVGDWQRAYVELISVEPSSDAGGLQVLDNANPVTIMGRSTLVKQAGVAGVGGGVVGCVVAWTLAARRARRRTRNPAEDEVARPSVAREAAKPRSTHPPAPIGTEAASSPDVGTPPHRTAGSSSTKEAAGRR